MAIVDLILRSAVVWFSLLRSSYYYNLVGIVCYISLVYNLLIYDGLSIYVCFKLSQDTPADVYLQLLYFGVQ